LKRLKKAELTLQQSTPVLMAVTGSWTLRKNLVTLINHSTGSFDTASKSVQGNAAHELFTINQALKSELVLLRGNQDSRMKWYGTFEKNQNLFFRRNTVKTGTDG
jgi:uncharacterized protein YfaT (DUF1175 family)